MRSPFDELIAAAANRHGVPLNLVRALVQVESGFNTFAWNPEPHYRYLVDVRTKQPFRALTAAENASETPPADFLCLAGDRDQEWWGQQASWGLMQLMGAVARERGFNGSYLPQLTDPAINVEFGCAHLAHLIRRHQPTFGLDGAIAAYNTGGPARPPGGAGEIYVRKVRAAWGA